MTPHEDHDLLRRVAELAPDAHFASLRERAAVAYWLEPDPAAPERDRLGALASRPSGSLATLEGATHEAAGGMWLHHGPCSEANAAALRRLLPNLAPRPLGLATSVGFGDRLGLATPGHVRALREADPDGRIRPIFAQQSIREMTRTNRTPAQVIGDATWGAFAAGWLASVGGDADHLKTPEEVRTCVAAGFTTFTLDPGDQVDDDATTATSGVLDAKLSAVPWDRLHITKGEMRRRYVGRTVAADGLELRLSDETVSRAAAKYGAALAQVAQLHEALRLSGAPYEIEVSVDETETPTTFEEHAFLALELERLEVPFVALAPRFAGFEKGVDYRGDVGELATSLDGHARLARALGPYKLSLHSGSDKFSVYPLIAEATRGLVHLKTAGTSYLEALRVTASRDPELFREVLDLAYERFEADRASYRVGARREHVPTPMSLRDEELPPLLNEDDARQLLHVTFGSVMNEFRPRLVKLLVHASSDYEAALERHFVRHLDPFVPHASLPLGDTP